MENYSLNDIKEVIKSQCKINSESDLERASKLVHKLVENRDICFNSSNSEFKMGDLVYISNYGEIGAIVGKLDVFEETKEWKEKVKKSGGEKAFKLTGGVAEPSPRYLVISVSAEDDKQIESLKQIFGKGKTPKYESPAKSLNKFDKSLRVRYPKENTLTPLLTDQEALISTNIGIIKTDINNFCSHQCIFSENCSEECVLYKHKKK